MTYRFDRSARRPRPTAWAAGLFGSSCLALVLVLGHATPAVAQELDTPEAIIDHVDRLLRGESSGGRVRMEIETENWSRSMEMEVWSRGRNHSLVRVLSPRSEAGTATLMAEDQVWNYLPRADRTIKIPSSMMMGSWMGSHFTNDDLVKESQIVDDYDIAISFDGVRDGVRVWEFELTPLPEAAVVWGHLEYQVRQDDMMPTWVLYYDEDGAVARTMTFSDYKTMGGRLVPGTMRAVPSDKPNEYTRVLYQDLQFDLELPDDFFSLRNLRASR